MDVSFVYYPIIDIKGHYYGPDGQELKEEIQGVDLLLYGFLLNLENRNLADKTNVIIVADHGMTANANFVSKKRATRNKLVRKISAQKWARKLQR